MADIAFESSANAAALAYARRPPYIAYSVEVRVRPEGGAAGIEVASVVARTSDDRASVMRENASAPSVEAAYPLPPEVDALAQWAFQFRTGEDGPRMSVQYVRPKQYRLSIESKADVVVSSVAGYSIAYAPGEANHVHLESATAAMRAFEAGPGNMIYSDVWFDPATYLPQHVVLLGATERLDLTYRAVEGHWLLDHFTYTTKIGTGKSTRDYTIEAAYRDYRFPENMQAAAKP